MSDENFDTYFADSKKFLWATQKIVQRLRYRPVSLATDIQDRRQAVDYVSQALPELRLGLRVRRPPWCPAWQLEFTVRWTRPSGAATEWDKFLAVDGPTVCLYGFPDGERLAHWCLYNPRKLRRAYDEGLIRPIIREAEETGVMFAIFTRESMWRLGGIMIAEAFEERWTVCEELAKRMGLS